MILTSLLCYFYPASPPKENWLLALFMVHGAALVCFDASCNLISVSLHGALFRVYLKTTCHCGTATDNFRKVVRLWPCPPKCEHHLTIDT